MAKLRELLQTPPEPEGSPEEQLDALRDYLRKITQELEYLLTHLEADNINDTTFERISEMIPRPYTGLPLMDGDASPGTSGNWSRGNHRHPHDDTKADVTALEETAEDLADHIADKGNPHEVTKAQVGLSDVANERQYSAQNPPPIPTPEAVGAVPITREVNGYPLSSDVTLDYSDVGAIPASDKGSAGGVAELDSNGMVPSAHLPSYVDDVLEYASLSDFPVTGESGKIYVALDTNRTYRWSGSAYVEISESLALGETSSTAYRGDRGKTAYDHSQTTGNPHGTTAAEVGARPDTWMPSASDVGARPDTWTPSASDVGARPDTWVPDAEDVPYDNTQSGLTATDVQEAIDELAQGGGGGGPSPSDVNPQDLGTASPGVSNDYSRADHVHKLPSASDVGALAVDGTAAAADALAVSHTISGNQGWYKFFEVTCTAGATRSFDFFIANTYNRQSGILRVYINVSSSTTTISVHFISGTIPRSLVRWEYTNALILYINKGSDNGMYQFRVLSNASRTGAPLNLATRWKNEAVPDPTGAESASAEVLQYTSQAVSAGTAQQILSVSDPAITSNHILARIEFEDPNYIITGYTWTTAAGSLTVTGTCTAGTTANILLIWGAE